MCGRATSRVDGYCAQTLRATVDTELVYGPDYRVTVGPASGGSGPTPYWGAGPAQNARIILSRWPVLEVTQVQTCPNNLWPRKWTTLPAGYAEPAVPPLPIYNSVAPGGSAEGGQAIIVGGGYINWCYNRNGWAILVTYINGWPNSFTTKTRPSMTATRTWLVIRGNFTWNVDWNQLVPSIFMASSRSAGIPWSPARITSTKNGIHCHQNRKTITRRGR